MDNNNNKKSRKFLAIRKYVRSKQNLLNEDLDLIVDIVDNITNKCEPIAFENLPLSNKENILNELISFLISNGIKRNVNYEFVNNLFKKYCNCEISDERIIKMILKIEKENVVTYNDLLLFDQELKNKFKNYSLCAPEFENHIKKAVVNEENYKNKINSDWQFNTYIDGILKLL